MKDYFAYIRVSTARQGQKGVSLAEQRDAIQRYADHQGLAVCEWFEERETAAKCGRAKFADMIARLRRGQASGVLVHKIDRSARNLRDWADLGDLMDLGIEVQFVTENLDLASRGGRLTADIQAVVAADYIRNLRDETRKGFYGRLKQGLYPLPAPLGYLDRGSGQLKAIDPIRGPLVALAFELYATGEYSLDRLRQEITRRGLEDRNGRPVSRSALSRLLNNPFYSGVIRIAKTGESFEGRHEPLISPDTFSTVRDLLRGKTTIKARQHAFLFKGLLTCGQCLRQMTGEHQKGTVYYRCHNKRCRGNCIREEIIQSHLTATFERVRLSNDEAGLLLEELEKATAPDSDHVERERRALALQDKKLRVRLGRLTDLLIDDVIGEEEHHSRRQDILSKLAGLERRRAELTSENAAHTRWRTRLFELVKTAQLSLSAADRTEIRELLSEACSNFSVSAKKPSIELYPAYKALADRERVPSGCPCRDDFRTLASAIMRSTRNNRGIMR